MPELDPMERKIFALLAENGRMSNIELAAQIGVSEKTVRQRIRRLIERGGMRVVATLGDEAPPASRLVVLVRVESGQRFVVADRLASLPEVDEVHLTTGAYELVVLASFESDSDALGFYVRHIEQAPGIEESLSTHVVETITRATTRPNHFEQFDTEASEAGRLPELLDLVCDVATASLGADRVHVAVGDASPGDSAQSPQSSVMRWRGLSSRYVEEIGVKGREEGAVVPNVVKHNQHVFVPDAPTDPLFRSVSDLVVSEGFRSWLGLPVRTSETRRGTLCLYWNTVIGYREDLIQQAQELADILGKHLARYPAGSTGP